MQHFADNDYDLDRAIARHEGFPYLAKKCECWEGYKRVPGTKPCAPGSCEKCDSHSKENATKNSGAISDVVREVVALYSSQPQFAQVISRALMQMMQAAGQAAKAGIDGSLISQISDYVKYIYGLWTSGQVELDDVDQMLLSANFFGETNNALPGGYTAKFAAQGDKPSPNAAKDVLHALETGDNDSAKALLGNTDCPKECEVHAEGKCNHGFMSAGRTRVRYLLDDKTFDKSEENVAREAASSDDHIVDSNGFRGDHEEIRCPECGSDAESCYNYITKMYEADCPVCGLYELLEDPNDLRRN